MSVASRLWAGHRLLAATLVVAGSGLLPPSIARAQPRYSWSGWYVGGSIGHAWNDDGTVNPNATGSTTGLFAGEAPFIVASQLATLGPLDTNPDGLLGGVQTGYNLQFNAFVVGIEGDYSWADINGSNSRTSHSEFNIPREPGFGVTTTINAREQVDSLATLRARLGFTPVDQLLLYVTGGLAYGRVSSGIDVSMIETAVPPANNPCITFTPSSGSHSDSRTGWTAGGGGEWAFTQTVSAKFEYLHYDLGTLNYGANQSASISCPGSNPANTPLRSPILRRLLRSRETLFALA